MAAATAALVILPSLSGSDPAFASRGVWTPVVLAGEDGFSATCITDDAIHLFDKGMIGSVGRSTGHTAPGPRELTAADLETGTISAGGISLAAGSIGSDVAGVVYRSRTTGTWPRPYPRGASLCGCQEVSCRRPHERGSRST